MRPDGPFSLEITNWFIWNYKLNKRCWLWTFTVIYQQRHEQYESWIAGNFYSAELARFLPNLSDALNMYSHGGQGRAQSDWISWQTLQERCLRFKLLSPFTKWESNKDTSVTLVAALFYPPFPPFILSHTHTYLQAHTWGVIRVAWCLGFSDTAAGAQTVTWKLTPSLRALPPLLWIRYRWQHFPFIFTILEQL